MNIELSLFRVRKGKSKVVDKWMNFLNENMEEVLLTLDGEKMYVETIFREKCDDEEYIYWYSIQGENGIRVEESDSCIDMQISKSGNRIVTYLVNNFGVRSLDIFDFKDGKIYREYEFILD